MILKFETNVPIQVALAYDEGMLKEGRYGDQMMYTLAEPRDAITYLPMIVDERIHELGIVKGEVFCICKREVTREGSRKRSIEWQVWRPESELTGPLAKSLQAINGGKANGNGRPNASGQGAADERLLAPRSSATGVTQPPHNGKDTRTAIAGEDDAYEKHMAQYNAPPAPPAGRQLAPAGTQPPTKIPMDRAAVLAVRMMQRAMKESGEQWSDGARQDYTTTLLIGMQKEGWLAIPTLEVA